MKLIESTLTSETVFSGKLLKVKRDLVRMPDGSDAIREWIDHPGAAAVVPLLPDGNVILVRQYRYGPGKELLELPAGKFDGSSETPEQVAARELEEETGFAATDLVPMGGLYNAVGYANEVIHMFLATNLTQTEQALDPGEFLTVEFHPFDEMVARAVRGELEDMKTVSGLLLAHARLTAGFTSATP